MVRIQNAKAGRSGADAEDLVLMTFRVSAGLRRTLKRFAVDQDRSVQDVLTAAVSLYLRKNGVEVDR